MLAAPALSAPAPIVSPVPLAPQPRTITWTSATLAIASGSGSIIFSIGSGVSLGTLKYRLYIGGVDRTGEWYMANDSSIGMQSSSNSTAVVSVRFFEGSGTRPNPDDEVVIIETTTGQRLFGGDLASVEEVSPDGTTMIVIRCNCVGFAARLDKRDIGAYYEPNAIFWTPALMVADLLREHVPEEGIDWAGGDGGSAFLTEVIIQHTSATQAIRQVLQPWGLDFTVDAYKNLFVIDPTVGFGAAPFNISDGDTNHDTTGMTVRRDRSRIVTRVSVRSDLREPPMWTDTFTLDPSGVGFYPSKYRLTDKPVVLEDGDPKSVAEYASSATSYDYTYVPDGYGVSRSAGNGGSHEIKIIYPIPLQPVYTVEDTAAVALYGIREATIDVKDVYERERWAEIAAGELARRSAEFYAVSYPSRTSDLLRPGMSQTIALSRPLVPSRTFILDSINGSFVPTGSGGFWRWTVNANTGAIQGERNSVRTQQRIKAGLSQPQDRHRQVFAWDLAKTVDGLTNTGVALLDAANDPLPRGQVVITRVGFIYEVRLRFVTAPQNDPVELDVFLHRDSDPPVSIFANGEFITYSPGDAGTVVRMFNFAAQPYVLKVGDRLSAQFMTAEPTAMDGILEVEQQG